MAENEYFREALSNFTFEAAGGGAIRHLADLGCTMDEIEKQLLYPIPHKKVQKTVWEHLVKKRVILLEEPGKGETPEKAEYVKEYDRYGKASFRRIVLEAGAAAEQIIWKKQRYDFTGDGKLSVFLGEKCAGICQDRAYVSCDFGLQAREDPVGLERRLCVLDQRQKAYIAGIPWESKIVYHQLDARMREIVVRLYESGGYEGSCFFLETGEEIEILLSGGGMQGIRN